MDSISDSFCKKVSVEEKNLAIQFDLYEMQCNSDRLRSRVYFKETLIHYVKKMMTGGKSPVISPIISHCLHQYSTFQWSISLSLPVLNNGKQYTLHFKTAFFFLFPLNKPSEQIKMIKAGLVREDASVIIIFLSQMAVNINLKDNKALKSTKEKFICTKKTPLCLTCAQEKQTHK